MAITNYQAGNYKTVGKLQNNSVNGAMLIAKNRMIINIMLASYNVIRYSRKEKLKCYFNYFQLH